ncbi:MAG: hypothetical protein ACLU38_01345 [Dysosmobacter sp.]
MLLNLQRPATRHFDPGGAFGGRIRERTPSREALAANPDRGAERAGPDLNTAKRRSLEEIQRLVVGRGRRGPLSKCLRPAGEVRA